MCVQASLVPRRVVAYSTSYTLRIVSWLIFPIGVRVVLLDVVIEFLHEVVSGVV